MDYLVIEGYKSAAEEFSKETGLQHSVDLSTIETRMHIREAVQRGDVEQAIELVNNINPSILDSNPSLHFHLQQQRLIEYIRHGRVSEALAFAQTELASCGEENPEFLPELEHTMALLAFDVDNTGTPDQIVDLMAQNQRLKTAGELNAAILEELNQGRETKLLALVRLLCWGESMLDKRAEFPKADLKSGMIDKQTPRSSQASTLSLHSTHMVKLALYIKADLNAVTDLQPASDDFEWFFKVMIGPNCCSTQASRSIKVIISLSAGGLQLVSSRAPQIRFHKQAGPPSRTSEPPVTYQDNRELSTGHDTANFVWKCSECKRESSAKFDQFPDKSKLKPYQLAQDRGQDYAPLVVLDCRGLEFVGFDLRGTWKCVGAESGTVFPEVEFEDGEWTDYDEKTKEDVGISAVESKWERLK
ncbi:hypothetical protein FRC04_010163 [Tulasnella sp. 424]|nr:hypothetical protein FRC04_010163 [Tulasnella sp. 424]KAG8972569.1 hypothetical protein FRC05_009802 [Tulasnella sp. 425]